MLEELLTGSKLFEEMACNDWPRFFVLLTGDGELPPADLVGIFAGLAKREAILGVCEPEGEPALRLRLGDHMGHAPPIAQDLDGPLDSGETDRPRRRREALARRTLARALGRTPLEMRWRRGSRQGGWEWGGWSRAG